MASPSRTLLSIQYLRGLAALAVVVLHVGWVPFPAGHAGVDVFFVISGFIMVSVADRAVSPGAFLAARAARVLPLYWTVALLTAATNSDNPLSRVLPGLIFVQTPRWDGEVHLPVIQAWTLGYEALFYAAFAAALLLPVRHRLPALTLGLCGGVAFGQVWPAAHAALPYATDPMLLEFLAGAWLCRAWQAGRLPDVWTAWGMALAGVIAIVLQHRGADMDGRALAFGVPALMIVAGALSLEHQRRLPPVPGLALPGDASYALYLIHFLVFGLARKSLEALPTMLALPSILTLCCGAAVMVHWYVERPMSRCLSGVLAPRRVKIQHAGE